jgi:3-hydroxyisobutyrate dehydrogenase-like beta-hydroxyacid dehydrogenase
MQATPTVGLIGIGNMGMPIARRLAQAGFELNAFARRPEVIAQVRDLGAHIAGSIAALGEASDVVIVNVFSDDQVRELALGPHGVVTHMRAGTTLVSHTTGRPSTIEQVAHEASTRAVRTLDAVMSGGPADIEAGRLTLLVGGDERALDDVRSVFESYSDPIVHVGAVGDAQRVKLLNNVLFAAQLALAARIEQSARAFGVDPARALAAIHECSGDSYALATAATIGSASQLVAAAARWIEKDVAVVAEVAAECNVDLGPVLPIAREVRLRD